MSKELMAALRVRRFLTAAPPSKPRRGGLFIARLCPMKHSFCFSAARFWSFRFGRAVRWVFWPHTELVGWRAAGKQKGRWFGSRPSIDRPPLRGLNHGPSSGAYASPSNMWVMTRHLCHFTPHRKGEPHKVKMALRLRRETTMTLAWKADQFLRVRTPFHDKAFSPHVGCRCARFRPRACSFGGYKAQGRTCF